MGVSCFAAPDYAGQSGLESGQETKRSSALTGFLAWCGTSEESRQA
jgi:hypothetical protein